MKHDKERRAPPIGAGAMEELAKRAKDIKSRAELMEQLKNAAMREVRAYIARDPDAIRRHGAEESLRKLEAGIEVAINVIDLSMREYEQAFERVLQDHYHLDVWLDNAAATLEAIALKLGVTPEEVLAQIPEA